MFSVSVVAFSVWATYLFGDYGVYLGTLTLLTWCVEFVAKIPSMIVGIIKTWMECKCPANAEIVNEFADLLQ